MLLTQTMLQGEERLMDCKRSLADEKRALEVAERKQKALQKKQEQVAAEAKVWRDKFDTEQAAADAEAAAEARCNKFPPLPRFDAGSNMTLHMVPAGC